MNSKVGRTHRLRNRTGSRFGRMVPGLSLAALSGALGLWAGLSLIDVSGGTSSRGVGNGVRQGLLTDGSVESGLEFVHFNGATGKLLLPEIMGAGGALFDYDNDGDLDLYLVQGGVLDTREIERTVTGTKSFQSQHQLYRNDLRIHPNGTRTLRFTNVTRESGIDARGYGMGVATGDFNNDGLVDLYVTNLGSNQMFRNNGDGSFSDVTTDTGTDDPRWSTSATFFDYDRDGWLDLFVANYVEFTLDMKRECFSTGTTRDYCNPNVYEPVPDRLFHNNGDGTFSDVSVRAGIGRAVGRGLGVVAVDVNADGWSDLYVANDGDANQLWMNQRGSGIFADNGLLAGVGLSRTGQAQGSMGVDAADFDGDGDEDLFVTNLDIESNTLYVNSGAGLFDDRTIEVGLFRLGFTGFGTRFFDYDNDGGLDLFVVNGAVRLQGSQTPPHDTQPLKQRNQVFHNESNGQFTDVTETVAPSFTEAHVSRGAAVGDLDNDGDTDVVVMANGGPARIILNNTGSRHHWLGLRVIDRRYSRDSIQARVELVRKDKHSLWGRVQTDGSYCVASDPRVRFGLGTDGTSQTIRVHWPGGHVEEFGELAVDRYWTLESGQPPRTR